jgi:hypothetical protein
LSRACIHATWGVGGVAATHGVVEVVGAEGDAAEGVAETPEHVIEDCPGLVLACIDAGAEDGGHGGGEFSTRRKLPRRSARGARRL